eukprot:20316-Chlamydomonas_euryale.AAC.2
MHRRWLSRSRRLGNCDGSPRRQVRSRLRQRYRQVTAVPVRTGKDRTSADVRYLPADQPMAKLEPLAAQPKRRERRDCGAQGASRRERGCLGAARVRACSLSRFGRPKYYRPQAAARTSTGAARAHAAMGLAKGGTGPSVEP